MTTRRVLLKLRSHANLGLAESRGKLRPLVDRDAPAGIFGAAETAQWYVADGLEGGDNPWDDAHTRITEQLGLHATDLVFAEPDIAHRSVYAGIDEADDLGVQGVDCSLEVKQTEEGGRKIVKDVFAWHLGDDYTQLAQARDAVPFADPRTRIAHLDSGYDPEHESTPQRLRADMGRNFVDASGEPTDGSTPYKPSFLPDNASHGTGTLSILAGGPATRHGGVVLGGAPAAEIVPLRVAKRVILVYSSALAAGIEYATRYGCEVMSISLGGLPSAAWNDAVNKAYESGICIVAAAGNNINGVVTRNIVYPARYDRVIAACGVMADHTPYADLSGLKTLEGNYGPKSRMASALAAYTPNIPWAQFTCPDGYRLNGEGTSAATPQIAAAAALWLEKYKLAFAGATWQRVEAVRHALFQSARSRSAYTRELGHGILQANEALAIQPRFDLPKTPADSGWFPLLRTLTGLGLHESTPRERMFNLELMQRWLVSDELRKIVPDPESDDPVSLQQQRRVLEATIEDASLSRRLRQHLKHRYPALSSGKSFVPATTPAATTAAAPEPARTLSSTPPAHRRLRVYAIDPSFSTRLETTAINEVVLPVRWETVEPGPIGDYLDLAALTHDTSAAAVDLDEPNLLAQDGWAPSEGNRAFHHQMVYAVAMKTISHFEHALGRPVQWRDAPTSGKKAKGNGFVRRLKVDPLAFEEANAYYSPRDIALRFGHFRATELGAGNFPGGRVYTSLSHDIIAHEATHAILDGMQGRFIQASNPDVLALHEGFADIVALLQHFTIPQVLAHEIGRTRGDMEAESILGSMAVQFGHAVSGRGALRDAIGRWEGGTWVRIKPDPVALDHVFTPHARGAILVAAVFDAFVAIYRARTADLLRIYTNGTGVLPSGAIHPDLVERLSTEAAAAAEHTLNMCIRAMDYVPPVDITFGEYLRGIITADSDVFPQDPYHYRIAFIESFRARGIYPRDVETLSVDTLHWQGLEPPRTSGRQQAAVDKSYLEIAGDLRTYAESCVYAKDRRTLHDLTRKARESLKKRLRAEFGKTPTFAEDLGLDPKKKFEVHALRRSMRLTSDRREVPHAIVALTQSENWKIDGHKGVYEGGSTLIVDLVEPRVKYRIFKRMSSEARRTRTRAFLEDTHSDPLRSLLVSSTAGEPFAVLHATDDLADTGSGLD